MNCLRSLALLAIIQITPEIQHVMEQPAESLSDDFLFPMNTSRLSYASSPESDMEMSPGPSASLSLGNLPQLVKSSSDPSIATNQDNLDRDRELGDALPPPYTVSCLLYASPMTPSNDLPEYSSRITTTLVRTVGLR